MAMIRLRPFRVTDVARLREVFQSSVHGLARDWYSAEQLAAWAPHDYDGAAWAQRLQQAQPWVAERGGVIVGYADLQPDGYIDQFFVAAEAAGCGVGTALMQHLLQQAAVNGLTQVHANVSRAAEGFFGRYGFVVECVQTVVVRGVPLQNARMVLSLSGAGS
ncbi:MAG: GNAT family N-acetyltransferase [Thiohalomonadaceae bacterium]